MSYVIVGIITLLVFLLFRWYYIEEQLMVHKNIISELGSRIDELENK